MKKLVAVALMLVLALSAFAVAEEAQVTSYEDFVAAEVGQLVTVETYVQANQSWWQDAITLYTQSPEGAYFLYSMPCSEEDAAKLVPGTKIRVTGRKAEWSGEVEISFDEDDREVGESVFEILEAEPFIAEPEDVTGLLGTEELAAMMNRKVAFRGMTVEPSTIEGDDTQYAFLYNWDGSGQEGANNDLYFNVSKDGTTYTFTVESYLTGEGSDVYEAVKALNVGDVVNLEGFLYWYNGANPHITAVTAAE